MPFHGGEMQGVHVIARCSIQRGAVSEKDLDHLLHVLSCMRINPTCRHACSQCAPTKRPGEAGSERGYLSH